jgi:hypothetical protein
LVVVDVVVELFILNCSKKLTRPKTITLLSGGKSGLFLSFSKSLFSKAYLRAKYFRNLNLETSKRKQEASSCRQKQEFTKKELSLYKTLLTTLRRTQITLKPAQ